MAMSWWGPEARVDSPRPTKQSSAWDVRSRHRHCCRLVKFRRTDRLGIVRHEQSTRALPRGPTTWSATGEFETGTVPVVTRSTSLVRSSVLSPSTGCSSRPAFEQRFVIGFDVTSDIHPVVTSPRRRSRRSFTGADHRQSRASPRRQARSLQGSAFTKRDT